MDSHRACEQRGVDETRKVITTTCATNRAQETGLGKAGMLSTFNWSIKCNILSDILYDNNKRVHGMIEYTWYFGSAILQNCESFWSSLRCHRWSQQELMLWSGKHKILRWRHNEYDGVSNYRRLDCLLNRLFRRRSKKTSKHRVTGLCVGNSPVTGEFPTQRASNAESVSIWWRHHGYIDCPIIMTLWWHISDSMLLKSFQDWLVGIVVDVSLYDLYRSYQPCHSAWLELPSNLECKTYLNTQHVADHSDVVEASPVGAAPTTSSSPTWYWVSIDSTKTTVRQEKNISVLEFGATYIRGLTVFQIHCSLACRSSAYYGGGVNKYPWLW